MHIVKNSFLTGEEIVSQVLMNSSDAIYIKRKAISPLFVNSILD